MKTPKPEEAFVARLRELLEDSTTTLDAGTRDRLAHLRRAALDAGLAREKTAPRLWRRWPVWAAVATATIVAAVHFSAPRPPNELAAVRAVEDLEIIAAADGLEFFEQLEFYTWLADEENAV
jgi:hypothetical protein